ncbi:DUF2249 domain-containing protein [Chitinophaga silvisoli]|uniref:DUF2249 domain-containing protein n=1 Tax=Chitinophaga silvisoli TaxID=2291814 RepID=A0A3E1NV51_9BACT|nr:DUF2249 domain-containing protein [Chitinophaga silvisoli]RFM31832.1 DUF2249 domain-containing protein [Chitinophaga silvisoli]
MTINQNTKIAAILKHHPAALDAIIAISPKFEKLRNPVLRKLMAGRASIAVASKIGGCSVADFYTQLAPLGFEIDAVTSTVTVAQNEMPDFIRTLQEDKVVILDVRPQIASGEDPLRLIFQKVETLQGGQVLKIVNTFEPTPLMVLLKKQGFDAYAAQIEEDLVETWFYKTRTMRPPEVKIQTEHWDEILKRFQDKLHTIDVRALQMPLPMYTILEKLDTLPEAQALFVYHKRIPVFLLPELSQRGFEYRAKEIAGDEVHLLIFRN